MVVRVSIKCPVPSQLSLSESLGCLNVDAWPPCKMQLFQLGNIYIYTQREACHVV